jgi:hypothetical protein
MRVFILLKETIHYVFGCTDSPLFFVTVIGVYSNEDRAERRREVLEDTYQPEDGDVVSFSVVESEVE